ncbi:hypothetical protein H2198_000089 [Neophaeococcomyces mojaviensis]|uniref:Uncharacterized protein n=1 Tax=Neophaeococcomyces mojaviensis TaxID=3383035 RepID=A0ACC3ALM0_9EURO|nr:hypothetical protein H2198_000089 [Knufia sp. JES_112]
MARLPENNSVKISATAKPALLNDKDQTSPHARSGSARAKPKKSVFSFSDLGSDSDSSSSFDSDESDTTNPPKPSSAKFLCRSVSRELSSGSGTPVSVTESEEESSPKNPSLKPKSSTEKTPDNPFNARTPDPAKKSDKSAESAATINPKPVPIPDLMTGKRISQAAIDEAKIQAAKLQKTSFQKFSSDVFGANNDIAKQIIDGRKASTRIKKEVGSGSETSGRADAKKDKEKSKKRKREEDGRQDDDNDEKGAKKKSKKDMKKEKATKQGKDNDDSASEENKVEISPRKKKLKKKSKDKVEKKHKAKHGRTSDENEDDSLSKKKKHKKSRKSKDKSGAESEKHKRKSEALSTTPGAPTTETEPSQNEKKKEQFHNPTTSTLSQTATLARTTAAEKKVIKSIKSLLPIPLLITTLNKLKAEHAPHKPDRPQKNDPQPELALTAPPESTDDNLVILTAARDALILLPGKRLGFDLAAAIGTMQDNADGEQNPRVRSQVRSKGTTSMPRISEMEIELSRIARERQRVIERLEGENRALRERVHR